MVTFNYEQEILERIKSKDKEERVVALFMRAKRMKPENIHQIDSIIERNRGIAKELYHYSDKKIMATLKYLMDTADYKWTLGTVIKHVDEDFEEITGKEPIIILSNGERIYDIETLSRYEKDGKIRYDGRRWQENL